MGNMCNRCNGTKKYAGTGYMMIDCELCLAPAAQVKPFKLEKSSSEYKKAVKEIMALDKTMSKERAEELFEASL